MQRDRPHSAVCNTAAVGSCQPSDVTWTKTRSSEERWVRIVLLHGTQRLLSCAILGSMKKAGAPQLQVAAESSPLGGTGILAKNKAVMPIPATRQLIPKAKE
jgi:hypothetical protein